MPVFQFSGGRNPTHSRRGDGKLDFWKTETGDQIGMQLMARRPPLPADRGDFPISILESLVCPVFGEQIGIITESIRPSRDSQQFSAKDR